MWESTAKAGGDDVNAEIGAVPSVSKTLGPLRNYGDEVVISATLADFPPDAA